MMSLICAFCCAPGEGNRIPLLQVLVLVTIAFQEGYNLLSVH